MAITEEASFVHGFRLGAKIMLEVLEEPKPAS